MKTLTVYLDFISPYAYLAFERLPQALMGLSYRTVYKPVLFAGLLKVHGQLGPAEIPVKRDWTFRQVLWLARTYSIPLDLPAAHPFNPLPLLRLAVAREASGAPNRHVCTQIFHHVWRGGASATDGQRLDVLRASVAPPDDPASDAVKARLKANTDEAINAGAFGVPTFVVDGRVFWGLDSLPMVRAAIEDDRWFRADGDWDRVLAIGVEIQRTRKESPGG